MMSTSTVASMTRHAAIAKGEKSTSAMVMHRNDVPHRALTSSSLPISNKVGGRMVVKILPKTHCKVITTPQHDRVYKA